MNGQTANGDWSSEESQLHINVLELFAVRNSLESLQHLLVGKRVHQPSRRDEVSLSMSSNQEAPPVVPGQQNNVVSNAYSRNREHVGRQFITRDFSPSNGMVSSETYRADDISGDVDTNNRPVCHQKEPPVTSLLHEKEGHSSICGGRSVHQLDRAVSLCIPSDISSTQGTDKDHSGTMHNSTGGAVLAPPTMVSASLTTPGGHSTISPGSTRSSAYAGISGSVSRRSIITFNCLDAIKQRYRKKGLSGKAAKFIAEGRREATLKAYTSRLRLFIEWCKSREITYNRASVSEVADFLIERFETGIQASTVRGYLSAILVIHLGTPDGESLKRSETLKLLIERMHNSAPPRRKIWPAWNLDMVLDTLNQQPFEPILSASLRDVAIKTAFLVAIASGRRCSEIHALAIDNHIVFSRQGAVLYFRPKFLAKNERSNFKASPILLPKLTNSASSRRLS